MFSQSSASTSLILAKNSISEESRIFLSGRKVLTYLYFSTLFTHAHSHTTNCIKWRSCILEGSYDMHNYQTTLQHQSQPCNLSAISQHLPVFSSPGFFSSSSASYFSRHSCSCAVLFSPPNHTCSPTCFHRLNPALMEGRLMLYKRGALELI